MPSAAIWLVLAFPASGIESSSLRIKWTKLVPIWPGAGVTLPRIVTVGRDWRANTRSLNSLATSIVIRWA